MKRPVVVCTCAFWVVIGANGLLPRVAMPAARAAVPQKKGNQGEVVGAVWEFEAKESARKDAKVIESGRFRAKLDGELTNPKGKHIGTYVYTNKAQDRVKLTIKEGKLKGTIEVVQQGFKSPSYQGEWKMEGGKTAHMTLKMIKD